ncbi:extracellular catalytic domain type 1 short-chain-length polyhydroxyalkanoate depolymerase [Methylobacterium nodulans]|uniref:Esterase, PHB depolymerase family n=1 Tax=Methylobacterium nodulans (strain LMG 21967 / CNCM I-2342 / ORS 2060) TaxID=460265 RepID=B8IJ10_METNO|nr:PHB depolymerase family esterase [Methylobacterium nodulans]ACL61805.1 esterase, PHB depolymerase family [Methylobacterium nodulans ORS 2060]
MRNKILPGMAEVTRLTRAGRLGEALSLIQRVVRGRNPDSGAPAPSASAELASAQPTFPKPTVPRPAAAPLRAPQARVMAAPTPGATAPEPPVPPRPAPAAPGLPGGLSGLPGGLPGLPDSLRDLMREIGKVGPLFDGLAEPTVPASTEPGLFLDRSFANAAGQRAYKLYVPRGYRGQAVPLVVMLHGCTQSPDDFAAGTGMNRIAEAETFLVAYPAQTAAANHARCWNWFNTTDQRRDRGEASIIAGIARAVMEDYAVDSRRVYVAGLSAGGAAAANLAAAYPDLFAAVGIHSGLCAGAASDLTSALRAMRDGARAVTPVRDALPTIVFHGDQDSTVHPRNGAAIIAATGGTLLREEAGVSPNGRTWRRSILADGRGRPIFEHWVIQGSGHAWSGGDAAGSYTDPLGPDASREMWRFFREHAITRH